MIFESLQTKRHFISSKMVVGVDPARERHQVAIIDDNGIALCKPFSCKTDASGFSKLFTQLSSLEVKVNPNNCVFAIERSCNLWQTLAHYAHGKGYPVVLVSAVTTKRSRPFFQPRLLPKEMPCWSLPMLKVAISTTSRTSQTRCEPKIN